MISIRRDYIAECRPLSAQANQRTEMVSTTDHTAFTCSRDNVITNCNHHKIHIVGKSGILLIHTPTESSTSTDFPVHKYFSLDIERKSVPPVGVVSGVHTNGCSPQGLIVGLQRLQN